MIESAVLWLLGVLAVPEIGLASVFIVSLVSATLLPMGSEPAVFAVVKANGALFWPVIAVATVGNTIGGVINYWLGYGAKHVLRRTRRTQVLGWFERFGAKTMLLSWLPGIGDPLCSVAGWLKLPFWPCVAYMAAGKFARYVVMTALLLYVPDAFWHQLAAVLPF